MGMTTQPYSVTFNVGYGRMTWETYETEYRARVNALKLASLTEPTITIDVLRRGKPIKYLSWVGFGDRHPQTVTPAMLLAMDLPDDPFVDWVVQGPDHKFTSEDSWGLVRSAIVQQAVVLMMKSEYRGDIQTAIEESAETLMEDPIPLTTFHSGEMARIQSDVARLVRVHTNLKGVPQMAAKTKERAGITVVDENDNVLGMPESGIDAVNFGDEEGDEPAPQSAMEREAAAAGVPVVRKEPKAATYCLYTGRQTSGGRFTPGGDAKLKGALIKRFRGQPDKDIITDDMRPDLRERFTSGDLQTSEQALHELVRLGWEKYATAAPVRPKKEKVVKEGTQDMTPVAAAEHGNYEIRNTDGEVIHKTTSDEAALDWISENGFELEESGDGFIVVYPLDGGDDSDDADE